MSDLGQTVRDRVDPALREMLASLPDLVFDDDLVRTLRQGPRLLASPAGDPGDHVVSAVRMIDGFAGAPRLAVHVHRFVGPDRQPCLVHMHGGGFVIGSADTSATSLRRLCAELECTIVSVDYRLAPETRAPGQIEDCYAAFAWVNAQAAVLGVDAESIGLIGESAGGGLAAALALMIRDRGEYRITLLNVMYPMLDDRTCDRPADPLADALIWTRHNNRYGWTALLGHPPGLDGVSRYAAPGRADDLSGLPPTYIGVGDLDLFLEENLHFAARLASAGVSVTVNVYEGAFHAFDLHPTAPIATDARTDRLRSLKRHLRREISGIAPPAIAPTPIGNTL